MLASIIQAVDLYLGILYLVLAGAAFYARPRQDGGIARRTVRKAATGGTSRHEAIRREVA